MHRPIRNTLLIAAAAFAFGAVAQAEDAAPNGRAALTAPAGFVAPAEPRPQETTAQRAISQPGNNAPLWREVRGAGEAQAPSTGQPGPPAAEKTTLIQPFVQYPGSRFTTAGEAWRQVRNNWLIPYGGSLLLIVALAIALFHWRKGPLGHAPNKGGAIERFTYFERAAHWSNAFAFVVLAISGIVIAFGKFFVLPIVGASLFGWLTYGLKTAHNFVGPLFAVSLAIVFFTFLRDELPRRGDLTWLRRFGGMLGGKEVPSHRFNAGEKVVFWGGVLLLGAIVVGSGLVLNQLVPNLAYTRDTMQVGHMIHAVAALLMTALFLGHIYIGTIGMRGAYRAMRDGSVDAEWAEEHHALWYADVKAGRIPAQRTQAPAPQPVKAPVRP
jgi:formate dehydrogenase subunit gamma